MKANNFWEYPPLPYLEHVLKNCPKAGLTYLNLWQKCDKNMRYSVPSDRIPYHTLQATAAFKHNLLLLVREGLISIHEGDKDISIELVDWEDD